MNTEPVSVYFSALELFGIYPEDLIGEVSFNPLSSYDIMMGKKKDTVGIRVDDLDVELFKICYDSERSGYYFIWHDLLLGVHRNNNFAMQAYNDLYKDDPPYRDWLVPVSEANKYIIQIYENLVTVFVKYDVPMLPHNFKKALVFMSSMIRRNDLTTYPALVFSPEQVCDYIKANFSYRIIMVLKERGIVLGSPEYSMLLNVFKNSPDEWIQGFLS